MLYLAHKAMHPEGIQRDDGSWASGDIETFIPAERHRAIVEAVTAADGTAAEAAMRTHLASVIDVLRHWEAFDTRA